MSDLLDLGSTGLQQDRYRPRLTPAIRTNHSRDNLLFQGQAPLAKSTWSAAATGIEIGAPSGPALTLSASVLPPQS